MTIITIITIITTITITIIITIIILLWFYIITIILWIPSIQWRFSPSPSHNTQERVEPHEWQLFTPRRRHGAPGRERERETRVTLR